MESLFVIVNQPQFPCRRSDTSLSLAGSTLFDSASCRFVSLGIVASLPQWKARFSVTKSYSFIFITGNPFCDVLCFPPLLFFFSVKVVLIFFLAFSPTFLVRLFFRPCLHETLSVFSSLPGATCDAIFIGGVFVYNTSGRLFLLRTSPCKVESAGRATRVRLIRVHD